MFERLKAAWEILTYKPDERPECLISPDGFHEWTGRSYTRADVINETEFAIRKLSRGFEKCPWCGKETVSLTTPPVACWVWKEDREEPPTPDPVPTRSLQDD